MQLSHLAIQKAIVKLLPQSLTEHHFSTIQRIADVVYFPKKIIFEVQCSPIALKDVQSRNRDYNALGFTVIWILHDRIYNKKIVTQTELYLRQNLSYYTSITPFGHGFFYDQLDFFKGLERIYQSKPLLIKNLLPEPLKAPFFFPQKLKNRSLFLPGDASDFLISKKQGKWGWKLEKALSKKWTLKKIMREVLDTLLHEHASGSHKDLERQSRG